MGSGAIDAPGARRDAGEGADPAPDPLLDTMRARLVAAARAFSDSAERIDTLLAEAAPFVESARGAEGEELVATAPSWREARSFAWLLAYRLGDQGWPAPLAAAVIPAWRDALGTPWATRAADEVQALMLEGYARGREDRARTEAQKGLAAALPVAEIGSHVMLVVAAGALDADGARALADRASAALLRKDARAAVLDIEGLVAPSAAVLVELWAVASAARMLGAKLVVSGVTGLVGEALRAANVHDEGEVRVATLAQGVAEALRATGASLGGPEGVAGWVRALFGGRKGRAERR